MNGMMSGGSRGHAEARPASVNGEMKRARAEARIARLQAKLERQRARDATEDQIEETERSIRHYQAVLVMLETGE